MDVHPTHTCFDDALEFIELLVKAHPDKKKEIYTEMFIVHAICLLPDGKPYAHAWVEDAREDTCIFLGIVNGEAIYLEASKAEYYENFKVQETTKYSINEAIAENYKNNNYGPWVEKYRALTKDKKTN